MSAKRLKIISIVLMASGLAAAAGAARADPGPRTDRFGDPLPPGALARMGTIRYARGDSTDGPPALAPDHKTFATVSRYTPYGDGRVVCLWDAATGKELRHFDDPDFLPYEVFFLRGENLLGVLAVSREAGKGGENVYAMQFWDPATGKKARGGIQTPGLPLQPWALSADENWVASAGRGPPVRVRERRTGKVLAEWKGAAARVDHLAFSPDGKTVAVCCGAFIRLWDWKGGAKDRQIGEFPDGTQQIWFSPDGRWLAAALPKEGLRVWETGGLKEVRRLPGEHDVRFFPDGKRLVSLDTGVVYDVASGKQVGRWEDCAHCLALDVSADGKEALGYALGRVRFWEPDAGKDHSPAQPSVPGMMIHQIGFLAGGKEVASASPDGAVRVWDAATGEERRTLIRGTTWDPQKSQATFMRVAPDGTILVARGPLLSLFKDENKAEEYRLTGFPDGLDCLGISSDGKTLALAGSDKGKPVMEAWDVPGRKAVARFSPPDGVGCFTLGVTCDRRIAAFVYGAPTILDVSGSVRRTLEGPPPDGNAGSYFYGVQAISFSPEGDLAAVSSPFGHGLRILDALTGKSRCVLPGRTAAELFNVVFSPDGRMVAAESEEGVVDVWETSSGLLRRRFRGHRSYQTTLAFSPDGGRLATGNRDGTILVWDVFGASGAGADAGPLTEKALDALWARLGAPDAGPACSAMGRLMRRPDDAGPYLKRRLLAHKSPEIARLRRWIADLDDDDFDTRETASNELAKCLPAAQPLLRGRLADTPSPEARWRVEELLSKLESHSPTPEIIRDLRAVEVLESYGPAFGDGMRELAEGDIHPWVAAAAKAACGRLARKRP